MNDTVLVAGGTGGTGLEAARLLRSANRPVAALVRPGSDASLLKEIGVSVNIGNALDAEAVSAFIAAHSAVAIISSLGGKRGEPRPDWDGNRNLIDSGKRAGITRFILVSAAGIGSSHDAVSAKAHEMLAPVLEMKAKAENYLLDSGMDYTIIRPGAMDSKPASGNAMLTEDPLTSGTIHRADLGQLVVGCIDDPSTIGKIYSAVDRELIGQTFF